MSGPKLLDLFCGAGGAGMGYHRAGFEVTGVDRKPMPRYPFSFVRADALEYLAEHGHEYDLIAASPPCQPFSRARFIHHGTTALDLVEQTRAALRATGRPYVIENVPDAPLIDPVMLCGSMFGLRVIRHRIFECSVPILFSPATCSHPKNAVGRYGMYGRGEWVTVAGHFSQVAKAREAMGIDWMTRDELAQAIPPAYTEYLGRQLLTAIGCEAAS